MAERCLVVEIERGERWWVASIPDIDGCHTQGRNLAQTRRNLRNCLALFIGERAAAAAEFDENIHFPPGIARGLQRLRAKIDRVRSLQDELEHARREFIELLTERGFSTHDVGSLVGLSKPRVAQILNGQ